MFCMFRMIIARRKKKEDTLGQGQVALGQDVVLYLSYLSYLSYCLICLSFHLLWLYYTYPLLYFDTPYAILLTVSVLYHTCIPHIKIDISPSEPSKKERHASPHPSGPATVPPVRTGSRPIVDPSLPPSSRTPPQQRSASPAHPLSERSLSSPSLPPLRKRMTSLKNA